MSTRSRLILIAAAVLMGGCVQPTDPLACQGNPKCKADTAPKPPTTLQPLQAGPAPR